MDNLGDMIARVEPAGAGWCVIWEHPDGRPGVTITLCGTNEQSAIERAKQPPPDLSTFSPIPIK